MHSRRSGEILNEKYRLTRLLGKGGMGSVWQAQHLLLNAPVAVKLIDAEQLDDEALARFLGEARMAAALRSPHVVQILDYGIDAGIPHIAMELLEGESLAQRLARVGRLAPAEAARVIQHVGRALGRAHEAGIVHRDLKPENVFIVANDDEELVKVLDFGIAKGTPATLGSSAAAQTRTGALLGTPYYMSPEQLDGDRSIDSRADLWSLGVLAYRCLLGELPFAGDSVGRLVLAICSRPLPVPSLVGPVPVGFDAWFARACAREPSARFESARQAAGELVVLCRVPGDAEARPLESERGGPAEVTPGSGVPPLAAGADAEAPGLVAGTSAEGAPIAVGDATGPKGLEMITGPAASADVMGEARTRQRRVAARAGAALALAAALLASARWSAREGSPGDASRAPLPNAAREAPPSLVAPVRAEPLPEPSHTEPEHAPPEHAPSGALPGGRDVLDPDAPPAAVSSPAPATPPAAPNAGAAPAETHPPGHAATDAPRERRAPRRTPQRTVEGAASRPPPRREAERARAVNTAPAAPPSAARPTEPLPERIPALPAADVDLGI